jgi:glycosyltransferase involved in cell wall biosynthesis
MSVPWLIVAADLTPLGGMDVANHALARFLAERGDEVHLVTHRAWPDLASMPAVTVHHVWRPFGTHLFGSPLLARVGRATWRRLQRRGAQGLVNGGNCSLPVANWVHYLHAAYQPQVAGPRFRRMKRQFTDVQDRAAERRALTRARVVICNSRQTERLVLERMPVDPARVHLVYYGSDPVRFSRIDDAQRIAARARLDCPGDRPLVGFVGALGDRRKGFDTLYMAWRALVSRFDWEANLVVIGAGAELPRWRARAQREGLGGRIHFLGFRSDVPDLLAALDLLVHPARYEAYGLSVHEAICRGVPALVSATAGVAERYPRTLAGLLLTDPDDPEELQHRLRCWYDGQAEYQRATRAFSEDLLSYTWDDMAARIARLVEQAA